MTDSDYINVLATQKRDMQIGMIVEYHPVYKGFNFVRYSNQKITEMYKILVEQKTKKNTGAQT